MKRVIPTLCLSLLGAVPSAQATTAPALNLTQQARKAEVIIRATIGTPGTTKDGENTFLVYPLTITETLAGDATTLPQQDGKPALFFLQGLSDVPPLNAGQDLILLLYKSRLDSPLVGFNQGYYPIVNGQVTFPGKTMLPLNPATGPAATVVPNPAPTPNPTNPTPDSTPSPAPGMPPAPTTAPESPPAPASPVPPPPATTPPTTPVPTANPTPSAAPTPDPNAFDPAWSDPAKFRQAILDARRSK